MPRPILLLLASTVLLLPAARAAGSPEALKAAQAALDTGGAEQAFFALEDAPPKDAGEKTAYADLLVRATELLLEAGDPVFALQLGKKSLTHDPSRLDARALCLQAALEAGSLDEAEAQLAALEQARPKDPAIALWRARLSAADAEWEQARVAADRVPTLPGVTAEQKAEAATLARRAEVAVEGEAKKLAALEALERREAKKQLKPGKQTARRAPAKAPPRTPGAGRAEAAIDALPEAKSGWAGVGPHVVLYCDGRRHCVRARARLQHHGVTFSERSVSKSGLAADELIELGFGPEAVPVYVMHGEATQSLSEVLARLREHGELH